MLFALQISACSAHANGGELKPGVTMTNANALVTIPEFCSVDVAKLSGFLPATKASEVAVVLSRI